MAEEDDLITIVDVTDPDDPSYSDVKTRRRYLTELELATIKPMLERVGAYKFFSLEFNFADGPAVKQFIESVELEEFKRCKQRKIVQESMKGVVAGREVVIDSELIEKAFGLVDDGENIIKPKGETNGLHSFYIKPKYIHLCQNYRGVYLKLFKSEYNYFVNMAHQIQTYCCGGTAESQITLTQYRAIDLMIRGKPVNWNRYLLQNFQDKLRKYKTGPCGLYFGGTLTALIYKALHVDYNLVNKPLLIPPQTPERLALPEAMEKSKSSSKKKENSSGQKLIKAPPTKKQPVKREVGAMTRAQRMLSPDPDVFELQLPPSKKANRAATAAALKALEKKRKRLRELEMAAKKHKSSSSGKGKRVEFSGKQKQVEEEHEDGEDSEPSGMQTDETEDDIPSSPLSLPPSPTGIKSPATAPAGFKSRKSGAIASPSDTRRTPATAPPPLQAMFTPETTPYTEGGVRKRVADVAKLGGEIVISTATNRLSKLFAYATGSGKKDGDSLALTESKDLWTKYDHLFSMQHEQQLEHIVSKVMLEQSLEKIQELEDALKEKDRELEELRSQQMKVVAPESEQGQEQQAPLKIRLKVGQKKVSAEVPGEDQSNGNGVEADAQQPVEEARATEEQPERSSEQAEAQKKAVILEEEEKQPEKSSEEQEKSSTAEKKSPIAEKIEQKKDEEMAEADGEKKNEPDTSNDAAPPAAETANK